MSTNKNIGGLFGGYLGIISFLGVITATFFVFILTGKNYNKLETERVLNLTIGSFVFFVFTLILFSFFYTGIDLIGLGFLLGFLIAFLTMISELIRIHYENEE